MNKDDLAYVKNKQIPDMLRGFRICTNYGDIQFTDERACARLAKAVALELDRQYRREVDYSEPSAD